MDRILDLQKIDNDQETDAVGGSTRSYAFCSTLSISCTKGVSGADEIIPI